MKARKNSIANSCIANDLVQNRAKHWAHVDNCPIDFGTTKLPPQLLSLTDAQIKGNIDPFHKFMTD